MNKRDAKAKAKNLSVEEAEAILKKVTEQEKTKKSKVNKLFTKAEMFEMMQGMVEEITANGRQTVHPLAAKNLLIDFA